MKVLKGLLYAILAVMPATSALAEWQGYDEASGDYVEIEGDNLVRRGLDIDRAFVAAFDIRTVEPC